MRPALVHLEHFAAANTIARQEPGGAAGGYQSIPQLLELFRHECDGALVIVAHAQEHRALARQRLAGAQVGLGQRPAEIEVAPHDLPRRFHLGTEHRVLAGEAVEG